MFLHNFDVVPDLMFNDLVVLRKLIEPEVAKASPTTK